MPKTIPFWTQQFSILLSKDYIFELWPQASMCYEQKMNAISRLIIIICILGYITTMNIKFILIGIITLAAIVYVYSNKLGIKEGLTPATDTPTVTPTVTPTATPTATATSTATQDTDAIAPTPATAEDVNVAPNQRSGFFRSICRCFKGMCSLLSRSCCCCCRRKRRGSVQLPNEV
jgi:hypothetical protein